MAKGFPVVLSDRGAPFVAVEKNAPLATVAENGRGLPIRLVEKGAPPIILQGGVAWTPLLLFLDGERGAWYDPSDLSTVFQNSAGTTAGAPGSPVGLIKAKAGDDLPASQATTSARPTLVRMPKTGRRNLIQASEDISSSYWRALGGGIKEGATRFSSGGVGARARLSASFISGDIKTGTKLSAYVDIYPDTELPSVQLSIRQSNEAEFPGFGSLEFVFDGVTPAPEGGEMEALDGGGWRLKVAGVSTMDTTLGANFFIYLPSARPAGVGFEATRFQAELGDPSPYQRVTNAYDVHEDGVPDVWYWQGDGTDDKLTLTLASAFTGYLFIAGTKGSILEPVSFSAGAVDLGPLTYTGGTPGIFNAIGGIVGVVLIDRELTEDEQTELVEYYKGKGAKGLLVEGPELVPGDFSEFADFSEAAAAGWVNGSAGAGSVDIMGDRLVILNVGNGANMGRAYHSFSAQSGSSFVVRATLAAAAGTQSKRCAINASTSWPPSPYLINSTGTSTGSYKFAYQASSTATHYIHFFNQDSDAVKGEWSNVSVRELRAEEDWT